MNTSTPTPTRVMLALAALLTILSMAWTGWSVVDLLRTLTPDTPLPVAIAVALAAELVWVAVVAAEWQHIHRSGIVPRALVWTGWGIAAATVAILALHAVLDTVLLLPLALLPLGAKTLWHWALASTGDAVAERLAAERDTSTDLTSEQQRELAELRRQAAYVRARADAERDLADAEHERRLEVLRRTAVEQMSADRSDADILRQRHELARELEMARPLALPPGEVAVVPGDLSSLSVSLPSMARAQQPFGFAPAATATPAAAMADTPGGPTATPTDGTSSDLDENPTATPGDWWPATPGGDTRRKVLDAIRLYGVDVSTRQLADELGLARSTVRQHRVALAEAGFDVYPAGSTDR